MLIENRTIPTNSSYFSETKSFEAENVKPDLSLNARVVETMFHSSSDNSRANVLVESGLFSMIDSDLGIKDFLMGLEKDGSFSLKELGYDGKPILELSVDEATDLISEGGFFSVENSARRASDFVIAGAGDDLSLLKAGREGIVKGFEEAERAWGGKLPDIAYESQKLALEQIDAKIQSLGGNALDVAA
jgi:hypothetical protein